MYLATPSLLNHNACTPRPTPPPPQVALGVLPLYALIQPLGSHCSRKLLKEAAKAGLNPRQVAVIARQLNLRVDQAV